MVLSQLISYIGRGSRGPEPRANRVQVGPSTAHTFKIGTPWIVPNVLMLQTTRELTWLCSVTWDQIVTQRAWVRISAKHDSDVSIPCFQSGCLCSCSTCCFQSGQVGSAFSPGVSQVIPKRLKCSNQDCKYFNG
jgi:hypothetical protein